MLKEQDNNINDYNHEHPNNRIDFIKKYSLKKIYDKNILKKYSNVIISEYKQYIIQKRKQLGLKTNQLRLSKCPPIKKEDVINIEQLATRKGRSRLLWYGVIYKITIINAKNPKEKYYGGMTTLTLPERWHMNIKSAFMKPETWHYPLINEIRNFIFQDLGFINENLKIDNSWNWKKIHGILDRKFTREVQIICFNHNSLRDEEINFIKENNLIDEGLNILDGGEGGPLIKLPMFFISKCICLGYDISKIHYLLKNKCKIKCSLQTVRQRIIDFWDSFEIAQIMFLRPMLELLIKLQFELFEINKLFNRFMLERIQLFFGGKSYRELRKKINQDWSRFNVQTPLPLWTTSGKPKAVIPINDLKYLICKYLYATQAVKDPKVKSLLSIYSSPRQEIVYQIQQQFDFEDWDKARKYIMIPYLIQKFRNGRLSPKNIYISIGYKPISAKTYDTLSRAIFFGLKTSEVKEFLEKYPLIENYNDFESILSTETRNKTKLSKQKIDELLFKYVRSIDMINELQGWFTGDFLKEVQKYYPNFKQAKWIVKAPYVIKKLRNLRDINSSSDLITIFRNIGYNKNSAKSNGSIFRDMFFGMGEKECINFFNNHLNICNYQEAKMLYLKIMKLKEIPNKRKKKK